MSSDAADVDPLETPAAIVTAPIDDYQYPEPTEQDFDDDIEDEEKNFYKEKYKDLNKVRKEKHHCTACDRHLGSAPKCEAKMRTHPLLRTLVCRACHQFYNSGEFERGDDGSELYCRWCGQGGQVFCCAGCPHVFCAKCIKRNLGVSVIKDIESVDDWKCFKCSPKVLWDLRASCWALLRYCELKNKRTYLTQDPELKEKLSKECNIDDTDCCKDKKKKKDHITPIRNTPRETAKKKESPVENAPKKESKKSPAPKENSENANKIAMDVVQKLPGIKVKKFASLNMEELKSAPVKRPIGNSPNSAAGTLPKKIKISNPMNFPMARPRAPMMPIMPAMMPSMSRPRAQTIIYNGYNQYSNNTSMDNLNLSIESLTQGLDMAAVAAMQAGPAEDDVVCTPDLPPLEPVCEVEEEDEEDEVQCMTPGTIPAPRTLPVRTPTLPPNISPDNIVQMTENDVTVNHATGGLKFRVDPQTLSSNKMYRLPDGRIFAINPNPKMPGGYSATIVAVTDGQKKGMSVPTRNMTFAAKVNPVPKKQDPPQNARRRSLLRKAAAKQKPASKPPNVEWYRYNLIDASDSLTYSLDKINKLKKKADTNYLRSRSGEDMKDLFQTFQRALTTSIKRFTEVKKSLEKGYADYVSKTGGQVSDDDVEILNEEHETIALGSDDDDVEKTQVLSASDEEAESILPDKNVKTYKRKSNKRSDEDDPEWNEAGKIDKKKHNKRKERRSERNESTDVLNSSQDDVQIDQEIKDQESILSDVTDTLVGNLKKTVEGKEDKARDKTDQVQANEAMDTDETNDNPAVDENIEKDSNNPAEVSKTAEKDNEEKDNDDRADVSENEKDDSKEEKDSVEKDNDNEAEKDTDSSAKNEDHVIEKDTESCAKNEDHVANDVENEEDSSAENEVKSADDEDNETEILPDNNLEAGESNMNECSDGLKEGDITMEDLLENGNGENEAETITSDKVADCNGDDETVKNSCNDIQMNDEMIDKLLEGGEMADDPDCQFSVAGLADTDLVSTFN